MARRKINLQDVKRPDTDVATTANTSIDELVKGMGSSELGFSPTNQTIYEIDLDRIRPDFTQPRRFLPFDLRESLQNNKLKPNEVIRELVARAENQDRLAMLILGGSKGILDEDAGEEADTGLISLAGTIKDVGLRQPINVYSITNPQIPGEQFYQIGEGERRYWAHHLLVLQGNQSFVKIRAIIETLPDDEEVIWRRQQAENAARQDLSALARARAIKQIQDRLGIALGTRVPNQTTIKLPSQRELDTAVGQEVKSFTGRAIGGRMVRNYLRLLNLSPHLQDLAEAAQLTEKQLRPIMRLQTDSEQLEMIMQIINEKLSGRDVLARVTTPPSSLKKISRTSVEQRLEKRLFQTATTVHEILALGEETYTAILQTLMPKMSDSSAREALISMRQMIDDLIGEFDSGYIEVELASIKPPTEVVTRYLTKTHREQLTNQHLSGIESFNLLLSWRDNDPLVASTLIEFFKQVERYATKIKAKELHLKPTLKNLTNTQTDAPFLYQVIDGKFIYWASILLLKDGDQAVKTITVEIKS